MELLIERLVPGGKALARLPDGRIALIQGPLAGDQIRLTQWRDHKSYVEGQTWELLHPSPDRVAPPCAVARECGGCNLMALSAGAQKTAKLGIVADALSRIGGLEQLPPLEWQAAPRSLAYRDRVQVRIDAHGRPGFLRRHSHEVVSTATCAVCEPPLQRALETLTSLSDQVDLAALQPLELRCLGERVSVRANISEEDLTTHPSRRRSRPPKSSRPTVARGSTAAALATLSQHFDTESTLSATLDRVELPHGCYTYVPRDAFVQINRDVNHLLVSALCEGAQARGVKRFLDLYCGSGNFALPLARIGMSGVGFESSASSIHAAERAAREQMLPLRFIVGDVARTASRPVLSETIEPVDLIVVDPPRAGARSIMSVLLNIRPKSVAMCSCDPSTLARDLKDLHAAGYAVARITVFDMFPQTHHVETLVWLDHREAPAPL